MGEISRGSAQRKADRDGEIEVIRGHARRKCRHGLRALDHRQHLGVEIGEAGTIDDAPRNDVAGAIDGEVKDHHALLVALSRPARIILELLQVFKQQRLPRRVDAGRARLRMITRGEVEGPWTCVLSGLSKDERVVAAPPADLRDGTAVRVTP